MEQLDLFNKDSYTFLCGAIFSECRRYRYLLWRIWDGSQKPALFIGLNPSTADETSDDPTVKRCIHLAKCWGYGGLVMANLFAFRATDPSHMKAHHDPIGQENDKYISAADRKAGITVCAWGNHGTHLNRYKPVLKLLENPYHLGMTKKGMPRHPLYLNNDAKLRRYGQAW